MKNLLILTAILLTAIAVTGCVNFSEQIILIADYEEQKGAIGGTFNLIALNSLSSDFTYQVTDLLKQDPETSHLVTPKENAPVAPLRWTLDEGECQDSLSALGILNLLISGLTMGIWPTIITSTQDYTLEMHNDVCHHLIPFKLKKRYMLGFLSLVIPVPGWSDWRGDKSKIEQGKAEILKEIIAAHLKEEDYLNYCRRNAAYPAGGQLEWQRKHQQKDAVLRPFAFQDNPERWRRIQQYRADLTVMQGDLQRVWRELTIMGQNPLQSQKYLTLYDRYVQLGNEYLNYWNKLEQDYYQPAP